MEPCCSVFLLRAISLQRYSVTVPYGEYFCLRQKENCSGLWTFRYSVTVWQFRMASISVMSKGKLFLASCNFVTALQCDSSVLRCMQAKEVCLSIGILCEWASSAQGRRRCKLNIRMNPYVSFVALRLILSSVKTLWLRCETCSR